MKNNNQGLKSHIIDAKGKILGRLSTDIANLLRGKNKLDFVYHQVVGDKVLVKNCSKIKFTGRKIEQKKYFHHSGPPGGLKEKSLKEIFNNNPSDILKKAVFGMLPKNKLRKIWMRNLTLYNEEIDNE